MRISCPRFLATAIVADDPFLAARLSCALSERESYVVVLDGPRMMRPDYRSEVQRRNNALARVSPVKTLLAGLSHDAGLAMAAILPKGHVRHTSDPDVDSFISDPRIRHSRPLRWGKDRIGLGLLKALYDRRMIEFVETSSSAEMIKGPGPHIVLCEEGELLTEVIAANYAFSIGASLRLIPQVSEVESKNLLEHYYGIDDVGVNPIERREFVKRQLRAFCEDFASPVGSSLTFITRRLPFGAAYPEVPSTHLFTYPDLGISIVNGFTAEQKGARGVNVAVLVDPAKVRAPEIEAATRLLPARGVFVRGYSGTAATVRHVTELVDLFPYDFLIFATHCGDAPGWRWTYEYSDSEGISRTLVVDIAIGVSDTDEPEMLNVMQYTRFHSLDGVDWSDPVAKESLYVGQAIADYVALTQSKQLEPIRKETIPRVVGSAAMAMADNHYIAMPRSLACEGSPIILNNACVSWHELASRFMFSNARAYIGTLYPVSDSEAEAVATQLIGKHFGKALPHAVWAAQNAVYGVPGDRRPYVVSGVYPQRLRVTKEDVPGHILHKMIEAARAWKRRLALGPTGSESIDRQNSDITQYYDREITALRRRWLD